ncbi:protein of unknown function [Magnetospirillum gryphiswaldense MSR-1 v2]|uniref:Uncharacterized protein n=2 Tax=Magnetospirillum gryphiswaldense TaxID=55518 RepID=V6EYV1_MAGGM|nr:protein of unknown function [Magnetospirillum gryphiswaldense MSR-1 v2]
MTTPTPDGSDAAPPIAMLAAKCCDPGVSPRVTVIDFAAVLSGGPEVRRAATPTGPVVVVSHFVAQGVLGAAAHHGHCGAMVEREYVEEAVAALGGLMDGAPVERILALLGEAARRGRNRERQDA